MTTTLDVFISSKMLELKPERDALYALLPTLDYGDIKLHAWVFEEDALASEQSIRDIYLKSLQNSALYLGLFWNQYGEYTIDEFERATEWGMERHIYVKDVEADKRDPQLADFLNKNGNVTSGITAKWFKTTDELCAAVKKSIESWIEERLRRRPGATSAILAQDPDDLTEKPRKLFGRDDLLREVRALLDAGERVLLQGFGGMGKTALAATIAAQWIRDGKGAALWLKTGSTPLDALLEALARPLNAAQIIARETGDAKTQTMRAMLRQSGVKLLVLDDCWNGAALFALLKVVPSGMPILLTARQRYSIEGKIRDVGELTRADSLRLLSYHADFAPPPYEVGQGVEGGDELCSLLGDHAFAIEIAGKVLKAQKWTPEKLLNDIRAAPHNLTLPLEFAEPGRENVAKLLDTSLNALDDETRAVFRSFGAFFAPALTAEMLRLYVGTQYVASFSAASLEKSLTTLELHGLVESIPPADNAHAHYRLHDLAYSYASAQNTESEHHHALDACLAYIERYAEPNLANFAALRPELDNLLKAADWSFIVGRYADVEIFPDRLYFGKSGWGILVMQGLSSMALQLLAQAAEAAAKQGDQQGYGAHLGNMGHAYLSLGNYSRAIEFFEQALDMSRMIEDRRSESGWLGNLGIINAELGEYSRAIEFFEQALDINRMIEDRGNEGNTLGNLGVAYAYLKIYPIAIDFFKQALTIHREVGNRQGEGNALAGLATIYDNLEKYPTAIDFFKQALTIHREIGNRQGEGNTLGSLATIYSILERRSYAFELNEQALVIHHQISNRMGEAYTLNNIGSLHEYLGDYTQAVSYFEQARAIFAEIGAVHRVALVDDNLANTRAKMAGASSSPEP